MSQIDLVDLDVAEDDLQEQDFQQTVHDKHENKHDNEPRAYYGKNGYEWSATLVCSRQGTNPVCNCLNEKRAFVGEPVSSEEEAFFKYFVYVWHNLFICTNQYIEISNEKRPSKAKLVDKDELKALFGLLLLCAQDKSHHNNVNQLFYDNVINRPILRKVMSAQHFVSILVLRFDDLQTRESQKKLNCFCPIRDLTEHINQNFLR